jgi:hypothetical protein
MIYAPLGLGPSHRATRSVCHGASWRSTRRMRVLTLLVTIAALLPGCSWMHFTAAEMALWKGRARWPSRFTCDMSAGRLSIELLRAALLASTARLKRHPSINKFEQARFLWPLCLTRRRLKLPQLTTRIGLNGMRCSRKTYRNGFINSRKKF